MTSAKMKPIWYLYAVINDEDIDLPIGIDEVPAQLVRSGGLAAVTAMLDPAAFDGEVDTVDLDEHGWLVKALRAHDRVVQQVFRQTTVLPFRFGALYGSATKLTEMLVAQRLRLRRMLELIGDAAEWSVEAEIRHQSDADSGTEWMLGRHRAASFQEKIHLALSAHSVRASDGFFLVRRSDEATFIRAASEIPRQLPGTRLKIAGPQPAYHFVESHDELRH